MAAWHVGGTREWDAGSTTPILENAGVALLLATSPGAVFPCRHGHDRGDGEDEVAKGIVGTSALGHGPGMWIDSGLCPSLSGGLEGRHVVERSSNRSRHG